MMEETIEELLLYILFINLFKVGVMGCLLFFVRERVVFGVAHIC